MIETQKENRRIILNNVFPSMEVKKVAKPFLKWAGGKTQLIESIEKALPHGFVNMNYTYIEPFVGSGAILFWILNKYPNINKAVINDTNADLINTYRIISSNPKELISILKDLQSEFYGLESDEEKEKLYYYEKRKITA